jgi:hypothetical protein
MPPQPQPYRLNVHDDVLDDLRERLSRTRWPDEIPGSGWKYGSSLAFIWRLTERWRDGFDWRAQEAKLNRFDQFQVPLDGINLHFIHQPGVGPDPLPLLLLHGWPGPWTSKRVRLHQYVRADRGAGERLLRPGDLGNEVLLDARTRFVATDRHGVPFVETGDRVTLTLRLCRGTGEATTAPRGRRRNVVQVLRGQ